MMIAPLDIFKKSWQIYRANFLTFLTVTVWLIVPALLVGLLNYIDSRLGQAFLNYSVPIYLTLSALSYVISLWVSIVLIRLIFKSLKNEAVERRALFRNAWRDTPSYLWVAILMGAASFVGTFFLIVPGIIFTVWFFFGSVILVLEGVRGAAALKASKQLVQNKFWPVLWRLVVPFGLYLLILSVLVGIPLYLYTYLTGASLQPDLQLSWPIDLYSRLLFILSLPLTKGFTVVLYDDLKK